MRRMITSKQIDKIENLPEIEKVDATMDHPVQYKVKIPTVDGDYSYFLLTLDSDGSPNITGYDHDEGQYLSFGNTGSGDSAVYLYEDGFNVSVPITNEDNSIYLDPNEGIQISSPNGDVGVTSKSFIFKDPEGMGVFDGQEENESIEGVKEYYLTMFGIPCAEKMIFKYQVCYHDTNDNEIVIAAKPEATIKNTPHLSWINNGTGYRLTDAETTQINSIQPTQIKIEIENNGGDIYGLTNTTISIGINEFTWDSEEEAFVRTAQWNNADYQLGYRITCKIKDSSKWIQLYNS